MSQDLYREVTAELLAKLAAGVRPWHRPWNTDHAAGRISRPLRFNEEPYSGVNVLLLWMTAAAKGYHAPIWMTYRQAQALGGHVKKGERGASVVFAATVSTPALDSETGESVERDIPIYKRYTVFNVEQTQGLPERFYAFAEPPVLDEADRNARTEAFFANTGAVIEHGGARAFYRPAQDRIQMPPFTAFHCPERYYAILGHETCHWTRHPSRLDRHFDTKRYGDAGYAMEELVAEIGSAYLIPIHRQSGINFLLRQFIVFCFYNIYF